jgi:hypothetical protein
MKQFVSYPISSLINNYFYVIMVCCEVVKYFMLKIVDSMSFVFNCFCSKPQPNKETSTKRDSFERNLYTIGEKHNISILPIQQAFDLDNLYPKSNHVQEWTTLVIGKDKTYILCNLGNISFVNSNKLVNHKGTGILPAALEEFFDPIWDNTLTGKNLQLFMVIDGRTYFMNTYSFKNNSAQSIGACMFLREFNTIPNVFSGYQKLPIDKNE